MTKRGETYFWVRYTAIISGFGIGVILMLPWLLKLSMVYAEWVRSF